MWPPPKHPLRMPRASAPQALLRLSEPHRGGARTRRRSIRRQRGRRAPRGDPAGGPHPGRLLGAPGHLGSDLRPRRRRADPLRRALPQCGPPARRGRPADPRAHAPRAPLDGDPGADPRRDHHVRLLQAAGDQGRAGGDGAGLEADRERRGPAVLLALPVSERRGVDQRAPAPGRKARRARDQRARLRREPQLVGPEPRGEDGRDPGQGEPPELRHAERARGLRRPVRGVLRGPARDDADPRPGRRGAASTRAGSPTS